jgi:hypothetical protein
MKHPTITITGSILAADILTEIEKGDNFQGQKASDFHLPKGEAVKEEIARLYADARFYWMGFKRQMERLDKQEKELGTTETRKFWMIPFFTFLGFDPVFSSAEYVQEKPYAISHRDRNLDNFPIHIVGYKDSLDRKVLGRFKMSPHALLQEYLNLTEHLYGFVTNGLRLRLLRDSSRLVKLSYLEFDLERLFEEEHYADFALLYRLLHKSRMPESQEKVAESLMEEYHQQALESGSRIREGLSEAVEASIRLLGDGFLQHPDNASLREAVEKEQISAEEYYEWLLRLIYRMLFLMVIEERNLVYDREAKDEQRRIYYDFYSLQRLRQLSENRFLADARFQDYWLSLKQTFRLFEAEKYGRPLGLKPLAGGLFRYDALGALNTASLDNAVLLKILRLLNVFTHPDSGQKIRVNYGALNVEEFGSVYEGLLEYDPVLRKSEGSKWRFDFAKGDARSRSGSHYTPDELVAPLIEHSLDYLIEDKLREAGWKSGNSNSKIQSQAEEALLSLTVCDVACGSGHILLNAARRIAQQLALVQTGDEQPSPEAQRSAIRQVIRNCIYGVDLNPLAVELCKVALWLEAHNPGEPLNFLDHRIKCGNSILGAGRLEDLMQGIPDEAFSSLPGFTDEEKKVAAKLKKANKKERKDRIERKQLSTSAMEQTRGSVQKLAEQLKKWSEMPENTPEEIAAKAKTYEGLSTGGGSIRLQQLADLQTAQFFLPKEDTADLMTDRDYYTLLHRSNAIQDRRAAKATAIAVEKRFFHWFLEFPEVFVQGGFDCILGNPPFLGGQRITGNYGYDFAIYIRRQYSPIGSVDLVTYFFRRIFEIIKKGGFLSLISTNTIAQGNAREGGLAIIQERGGAINHAVRSMHWPGQAAVEVSLVTIHKGEWKGALVLNRKEVDQITSYLDDQEFLGEPHPLEENQGKSFQGSIVLGKGFVLTPEEARALMDKNPKNKDVLFPYLNGSDLNTNVDQSPSRWVINFQDWPERRYTEEEWKALPNDQKNEIEERLEEDRAVEIAPPDYDFFVALDYPDCYEIVKQKVKPEREAITYSKNAKERWWVYERYRPELYSTIAPLKRVLVVAQVSKTVAFDFTVNDKVLDAKLIVFAFDSFQYFSSLQSTLHNIWAWKYCTTMKADLSYTPSAVFQTFPFPHPTKKAEDDLEYRGEYYHQFRQQLMPNLQLGLTKLYNQFHNPQLIQQVEDLPAKAFQKQYGKETWNLYNQLEKKKAGQVSYVEAVPLIEELRRLHKEMDEAVLAAYGWEDITLRHNFYPVDYLPENDNIRYTIHPEARKEVLKRLLLLNHERYREEGETENGQRSTKGSTEEGETENGQRSTKGRGSRKEGKTENGQRSTKESGSRKEGDDGKMDEGGQGRLF